MKKPLYTFVLVSFMIQIQAEKKTTDPTKSPYWPKDSYVEAGSTKTPMGEEGGGLKTFAGQEAGDLHEMPPKEEAGSTPTPATYEPAAIFENI